MTNNNLTWLSQSDAARRLGVSREAIRQAIAARRIEWNGKTGRDCRVRGDLLPARTLTPLTRAPKGSANKKSSPAPAATVPARAPKSSSAPKGPAQNTPADQLIDARLRKLESDIALQTMRLESHKQEIYNQALSDFQTAYESAFSPLKKFLLSLDLPPETLRKLAAIADQCDADFQSKITP